MARDVPDRGRVKRRKKKTPSYTPPQSSRSDAAQGRTPQTQTSRSDAAQGRTPQTQTSRSDAAQRPATSYTPPASTRSDAAQGTGATSKVTPKQSYARQTVADKKVTVDEAGKRRSHGVESKADREILRIHRLRMVRQRRDDAISDRQSLSNIYTDAERASNKKFVAAEKQKVENKKVEKSGLDSAFSTALGVLPGGKAAAPFASGALKVGFNLGRATVEDPVAVAKTSVRSAKESIAGIPQGIKELAKDPVGGIKAIGEDYERRYGSILDDPALFRKRVKEEYGLTPYALDSLGAFGGAGEGAGAVGRSGAAARAAEALSKTPGTRAAGRGLKAVTETATRDRPNLRFSGGEGGVRKQYTSKNLFIAAGQRGLDAKRKTRFANDVDRAGLEQAPKGKLRVTKPGPGRLGSVRPGENEVLPYYSPREAKFLRKMTGRVSRDIGGQKSKGRVRLLTQQHRVKMAVQKELKRLSPEEAQALKYSVQLGLPANASRAVAVLRKRLDDIKAARKGEGRDVAEVLRDTNDEVPILERIIADPEKFITPRLREATDAILKVQRETESVDPDLPQDRASIRRNTPQGATLGVTRGPDREFLLARLDEKGARGPGAEVLADAMPADRPRLAKEQRKGAEQAVGQADRKLQTALRQEAGFSATVRDRQARGATVTPRLLEKLEESRATVTAARTAKAEASDAWKITRKASAEVKKKSNMRLEAADKFDARVRAAADEAGLVEPGYWMSSPRPRQEYSNMAVGTGGKASGRSKQYTGSLYRIGAEESTPDVLVRGVERNVKRRFQWALVQRNMDVHAFEWSRGKKGEGLTGKQILKELDDRRIDAGDVAFLNPNVLRRRAPDAEGRERGAVEGETDLGDLPDDEVLRRSHDDLVAARTTVDELQADAAAGMAMNRYLVVPKAVADELQSMSSPDGAGLRALEIILKQKPSRILLGALNVPWLTFQLAANTVMTGLGGGKNPLDIYGAHKWWRGLDQAQKDAVEVELGITHGSHHQMDQTHLGSTKDNLGYAKHLVNFFQAYKASRVGRMAHKANPLDAMFRIDEAQNNFFRKVLFYNHAKKTAYKQMGASWKTMDGTQKKLMSVLGMPPERMGGAIAKHGEDFEKHAKAVNDFLGDYMTFSDQERRLLSRNVMFYGYLRFSIRFLFYTMPVEHPIMASVAGTIGQMGSDEIKDLFGVPRDESLAISQLGKVYFGNREDAKKGSLKSINFGRLNPALNSVVSMERPSQALGLVSPLYGAIAEQMFGESTFNGDDFTVRGFNSGAMSGADIELTGEDRARILAKTLLSFAYPYRLATKTGIPGTGIKPLEGPQGDDSLLFSPRPTVYKDKKILKSIGESVKADQAGGVGRILKEQVLPLTTPGRDIGPQIVASERKRKAEAAAKASGKKKSRRKKASGWGGGSSRSSGWTGSSKTSGGW